MENLNEIIDNLTQAISIINKNYEIVYTNRKIEELFRKKAKTGEKCYKFFKNRDKKCDDCPIEQNLLNTVIIQSSLGKQYQCLLKAVERFYIKEIFDFKKFSELFKTCLDEQKYIEIGHISAAIAHQVNNLLMGISGRIEALSMLRKEDKLDDNYFKKYIDKINENIISIKKLMEEILYFAHPERMEKKEVDINNLIRDLYIFSKYEIERPGLRFNLNLNEVPKIKCVEKLIMQLILMICRLLSKNFYNVEKNDKWILIETLYDKNDIVIKISDNNFKISEELEKIINQDNGSNYESFVIKYCLIFHEYEFNFNFDKQRGNEVKIFLKNE